MKKFIAITALTLAISVSAQEKNSDQMDNHRSKDKMEMYSNLNLTEKQKSEIKALWDEKKEDHRAIKSDLKSSKADKKEFTEAEKAEFKAKKEANRKEMDAKLQTILTPEQYKQFVSERAKRHEEKKSRKQNK